MAKLFMSYDLWWLHFLYNNIIVIFLYNKWKFVILYGQENQMH